MKTLGARFNKFLKKGEEKKPGWVLPISKREDLEEALGLKKKTTDNKRSNEDILNEKNTTKVSEKITFNADSIEIVDYSAHSLAVFGDTKPVKGQ